MDLSDLQAALRTRPFKPFRLHVSGNEAFDVRHSELCVPGYTSVFFRFPSPADANSPVFSRFTIIDLAHIIRLEPLETVPATAGNGSEG